jgi:predicted PurR-regulated permease PerM
MTRRRLYNTLLVLLTLIAVIYLMRLVWAIAAPFTDLLLLFAVAWLIAFILRPVATAMSQGALAQRLIVAVRARWGKGRAEMVRRILDPLAVTLVYLGLLALLIVGLIAIIPTIISETRQFAMHVPEYVDAASKWVMTVQQDLVQRSGLSIEVLNRFFNLQDVTRQITTVIEAMPRWIGMLIRNIASGIGQTLLALALSYYLMLDGPRLARQIYDLTPKRFHDEYELITDTISRTFGGFLRGQLVMAVLSGVVTAIAAGIAGLRYGAIIGAMAGLIIFIPVIGAPIAMFLPSAIALLQGATLLTAIVLLAFLTAFQQILLHLIVPRIMSESVGMPPVLILIAVLVATRLWGVWGFIFGIPVAGAIYTAGLVMLGRFKREQDRLDDTQDKDDS